MPGPADYCDGLMKSQKDNDRLSHTFASTTSRLYPVPTPVSTEVVLFMYTYLFTLQKDAPSPTAYEVADAYTHTQST